MSTESSPNRNAEDGLKEKINSNREKRAKNHARLVKLTNREKELDDEYNKLLREKLINDAATIVISNDKWAEENFEWSEKVREVLTSVFKLNDFRPQQLQAINGILSKKDVLMIAPTGGGKSLCYQLPAVLSDGVTIIVSPLISLMEDQVLSLKRKGIMAELFNEPLENENDENKKNNKKAMNAKNKEIIKQLSGEEPCHSKLFYVTPERITKNQAFMDALDKCYQSKKLNMIAVDEVHCCSQWGHDFRPSYLGLGILKEKFPDIPMLGVSATVTIDVLTELQKTLNLNETIILKAQFNRPNLYYHVFEKPANKNECIDLLTDLLKNRYANKSGIIYTLTCKDTEKLAEALISKGLKVSAYYAKMESSKRSEVQKNWLSGDIQAVVATVAFGMGIDKPNVRFVIHHTLSLRIEDYYQQTGRSGRDNLRAECILLYRCGDNEKITSMMHGKKNGLKNAYGMINYAIDGNSCRRDLIGKNFEGVWNQLPVCGRMCDRCFYEKDNAPQKINVMEYCYSILKIIENAEKLKVKLTFLKLIRAWFREGEKKLRVVNGSKPDLEKLEAERIISFLITNRFLEEEFKKPLVKTISYIKAGSRKLRTNAHIDYCNVPTMSLPEIDEQQWNKIYSSVPTKTEAPSKKGEKINLKEEV